MCCYIHSAACLELYKTLMCPFRWVRKIPKSDYYLRYVRSSVRMKHSGSHWKDFHDILHLNIFRKSVQKSQVSLKSYKNNGYFT